MLQIRLSSSENDAEIYNDDAYDNINIMKHEIFKKNYRNHLFYISKP